VALRAALGWAVGNKSAEFAPLAFSAFTAIIESTPRYYLKKYWKLDESSVYYLPSRFTMNAQEAED